MKEPVLIKKYSNRRLYDTMEKRYITLEDVAKLIRQGNEVQIVDNQTQHDITQETLLQIVFAESPNLFSTTMLHQMIQLQQKNLHQFLTYLQNGLDHLMDFKRMTRHWDMMSQFWMGPLHERPEGKKEKESSAEVDLSGIRQELDLYKKKIEELEEKMKNGEKP